MRSQYFYWTKNNSTTRKVIWRLDGEEGKKQEEQKEPRQFSASSRYSKLERFVSHILFHQFSHSRYLKCLVLFAWKPFTVSNPEIAYSWPPMENATPNNWEMPLKRSDPLKIKGEDTNQLISNLLSWVTPLFVHWLTNKAP